MGLQHSVPKRHHKNKRKNIMNIQEEKRVCFDVDQNKQKINFLLRKNKENETQQTELNQKLATAQSDINSLSSAVETLQNSTPTEEKIELLSYDIYKCVDNTYRDTIWQPKTVFFAAQPNSKVKLRVSFTTKNTFIKSVPRTATTKIILDDVEIYSSEKSYENGPEETPVEFTHIFTSNTGGHKIRLEITTPDKPNTYKYYIKPDFFTIEIFGTNVQFITRNHDFMVAAGPGKNVMTTTCIDEKPRFSVQTADENLSLDKSAFRTANFSNYRTFNFLTPFFDYTFAEDGTVTRYENPGLMWSCYPIMLSTLRISYATQITQSETENISHDHVILTDGAYSHCIRNFDQDNATYMLSINENNIVYHHIYSMEYITKDLGEQLADCAGLVRYDNFEIGKDIIAFATRVDGTSFMTRYIQNNTNPPRLELGVGTHINAYLRADDSIEVYMRVGKDCKKLIIKKDPNTQEYFVESSQIIENVQEYWLGANGTHFERVGNKINYYPQNATAPTQTFEVFY